MRKPMTENERQEVSQLLHRGLQRIRRGWTQFASTRGEDGTSQVPNHHATAWCATGALWEGLNADLYLVAIEELARLVLPSEAAMKMSTFATSVQAASIVSWYNDKPERTQQDIINLYEKALAELGGLGESH